MEGRGFESWRWQRIFSCKYLLKCICTTNLLQNFYKILVQFVCCTNCHVGVWQMNPKFEEDLKQAITQQCIF